MDIKVQKVKFHPMVAYLNSKIRLDHWISDFQSDLINSKQIQRNAKFDPQAHFNIYITSNGLDRLFGIWKLENDLVAPDFKNNRFDISQPSLFLYIYREIEIERELSYGELRSKGLVLLHGHIFVFKNQIVDLNRWL